MNQNLELAKKLAEIYLKNHNVFAIAETCIENFIRDK